MSCTGGTINQILPQHTPNEGRVIINDNFSKVICQITGTTFSITGGTTVQPGSYIYTGGTASSPTINLEPNIFVTSVSATTIYSGSTDLSLLLTGGSGSVLYTNSGSTPTTIGGIAAGSTFSLKTMQEMWDSLLYPYQVPAFTSFSRTNLSATYEVGEVVIIGLQTFTWATSNPSNVSINTVSIVQNIAPTTTLYGPAANTGSSALTTTSAYSASTPSTVTLYTISAVNSQSTPFSTTISRSWRHKRYWGTHPSFTLPSNANILAANGASVGAGNEFSTTRVQTRNGIDGAGNYLFFAWPTSFGTPTFIINGLPNSAWTKIGNAISFTNTQGFVETYDVWISDDAQNSPITLFSIT